jgi:hypothetical protein
VNTLVNTFGGNSYSVAVMQALLRRHIAEDSQAGGSVASPKRDLSVTFL